jgi:hypothetical protein
MKQCPKCKVEKSLSEYHIRTGKRAGTPSSYCKACMAAYSRQHYLSNKGEGKHSAHKAYIQRCKDYVRQIKEAAPCKDCEQKYPFYVMQFDHLYDKKMSVSQLFSRGGMPKILSEIAKCEIVCANCHAKRTWKRNN